MTQLDKLSSGADFREPVFCSGPCRSLMVKPEAMDTMTDLAIQADKTRFREDVDVEKRKECMRQRFWPDQAIRIPPTGPLCFATQINESV